jgi:hypothetical protein
MTPESRLRHPFEDAIVEEIATTVASEMEAEIRDEVSI